jgi:D-serine deaminase-like pyridoxal phosphate-dependent protein
MRARSPGCATTCRAATVAALRGAGHRLRFVNGGGTGSLESTRADGSVTELAAGSGLYAPTLFDGYRNFRALPAAGFALAVTRRPKPGIVTCAGGGYPASGPAGSDRLPRPWLPAGSALLDNEGAGEVQTPLRLASGTDLPIGAPVLFRHAKAGELCERFNQLLLIESGAVIGTATTYRGDGKCFF